MRYVVAIPEHLERLVRAHLFQSDLEQGAFLFAQVSSSPRELRLDTRDVYLVPPHGWDVQLDVYLEMADVERARIMKLARGGNSALIDCHSHPGSCEQVSFSPSDRRGILEYAGYAKWKLDGRPYTAMVWGESSIDAVAWYGDFAKPYPVSEVQITGETYQTWRPRGTWFRSPVSRRKLGAYGK